MGVEGVTGGGAAAVQTAAALVAYQEGSIVSRQIVKSDAGSVTAFAFAAGEGLSEHATPFTAVAHVIDGEARITVGGVAHTVRAGELIVMPAAIPHALHAPVPFKMVLVMVKGTS